MATTEEIAKQIHGILQQQTTAPRPSAAICTLISNLRDLIELQSAGVDWRRGPSGGDSMRFRTRNTVYSPPETPKKTVDTSGSASSGSPPPPVVKYQSKFKNSTQPVEDKILNNIILSKLNKFSPKTYDEIRDFLYQILGSGEVADLQEMTRDFMRLVFRKAAIEEMFCPLYAKLLCEISGRYRVILEEMHALQSNYIAIFDTVEEAEGTDYNTFVEMQKSKQFRVGYSQFLAELSGLEILDLDLLVTTFQRILSNMLTFGKEEERKTLLEEYSDCLVRMAKVLRRKPGAFFIRARARLLEASSAALTEMAENSAQFPSLSAKTRFILMDVHDILKGH